MLVSWFLIKSVVVCSLLEMYEIESAVGCDREVLLECANPILYCSACSYDACLKNLCL